MFKFLLLLSAITATSLSAEQVIGFNFGGELTDVGKYQKTSQEGAVNEFYKANDIKFFDSAEIVTDQNKKIKALFFKKTYTYNIYQIKIIRKEILKDFREILSSLEHRYGDFNKQDAEIILSEFGESNSFFMTSIMERAFHSSPNAKNISMITLQLKGEENGGFMTGDKRQVVLDLTYIDDEIKQKLYKSQKSRTEGF